MVNIWGKNGERTTTKKSQKISPFCYEATIPLGLMPLHRHGEEMGPWTFYILSLPPPIFCFLSHTRLSNSGPYPPPFIYCSLQCYKQRPQSVFQPSGHSYFSTRCPYAMHSLTFHAIAHLRHLFSHDFGSHCLAFLPEELNQKHRLGGWVFSSRCSKTQQSHSRSCVHSQTLGERSLISSLTSTVSVTSESRTYLLICSRTSCH